MGNDRVAGSTACPSEAGIWEYVHGDASAPARQGVEAHLASCAACSALVSAIGEELPEDHDARALLDAFTARQREVEGRIVAGKYRIARRLGAGGMGVVYEAVNTWTERRVALKLLHPSFSTDQELVARFVREAKSATRIEHPNIVQVLDLGQDPQDGALYMIQELLPGQTLRQYLGGRGPLSLAEAEGIMLPLWDALGAAHRAGVVHRDVKPENIVLCGEGGASERVPKLIDFGISKIVTGDPSAAVRTSRAIGTPAYMSPEQLRADVAIDGRADVWATGVVLFELLAGGRPFDAKSPMEVAVQILGHDAPSLTERVPEVAPELAAVVARALARDRDARFSTMDELAAAWRGAVRPVALARRPERRRRLAAAGLVFATVAALAAGRGLSTRARPLAGMASSSGRASPVAASASPPAASDPSRTPPSSPVIGPPGKVASPSPSSDQPRAAEPARSFLPSARAVEVRGSSPAPLQQAAQPARRTPMRAGSKRPPAGATRPVPAPPAVAPPAASPPAPESPQMLDL